MAEIQHEKSDGDFVQSLSEPEEDGVNSIVVAESKGKETPEKLVRRRRHATDTSEEVVCSDSESEVEDDVNVVKNSSREALVKVTEGSEYESAEEEKLVIIEDKVQESEPSNLEESVYEVVDEEGGEEAIAETEEVEGEFLPEDPNDEVSEDEEELEEGEYVEEERQQGDGEECSPADAATEKELDFDEDRRNPQYIPKKGIFYEHDDRNNETEVKEKEEEPIRDRKKKLWLDEGKWGHDRFREEEQNPKSQHELIETYGYDIRNEDGPPRARRRRRYGRGPTKYDRNWEDGTAYNREKFQSSPRGAPRSRRGIGGGREGPRFRGRGRRDFDNREDPRSPVALHSNREEVSDIKETIDTSQDSTIPVINTSDFPALPSKVVNPDEEKESEQSYVNKSVASENKSMRSMTFENSNFGGRNSTEREIPPRHNKNTPLLNTSQEHEQRKHISRGGRGSARGDFVRRSRGNARHISPRFLEQRIQNMNADMEQLSLEPNAPIGIVADNTIHGHRNDVPLSASDRDRQNVALKGGGDSSGRPKRYSSLRQRSLPETNSFQTAPSQPVQNTHPSYYETTGYQSTMYAPSETCVPTPSTQSQVVNSTPIINPSAYQTFTPPPYSENYGLRMPVTAPPPRLFPQVSVPAPQPLLTPQPIITPAPSMMTFAQPPPPAGYHQFAYQQYATPAPPPPPPAPPSEVYQTGITYYYPQNQPHAPVHPTVQKRPKAAIPIMPPPEREGRRGVKKESHSHVNSRNLSENPSEAGNLDVSSLRTESSSQLQSTVEVES